MTVFGQTLDAQQMFGLVSLLTLLAFWIVVLGREWRWVRWFRDWEAGRKAAREGGDRPDGPTSPPRGPWG